MDGFVATFSNRLDAKGRVSVPAPFRAVLAREGSEGLYCYPALDQPAVDNHRIQTTGFGNQHGLGGGLRQLSVNQLCNLGRTGKANTGNPWVGGQRASNTGSVARQQLQDIFGYAGLMQQGDRARRDQGRLFGRLGEHRIPGSQGGGNLAGEDGQRKIPR